MKTFDWNIARSRTKNPTKLNWLWINRNKKISEEKFVKEVKKMQPLSSAERRYKKYAPHTLKRNYRNLKEEFGFFTGELKENQ